MALKKEPKKPAKKNVKPNAKQIKGQKNASLTGHIKFSPFS
jgi:hypothetical protein